MIKTTYLNHSKKLVSENQLSEQYRISVAVLRCSLWSGGGTGGIADDAQLVGDKINKWLMRHDRLHEAVQFSNLLKNLMNSVSFLLIMKFSQYL